MKGIDINPQMLEIARKKAVEMGLIQNVELCELSVAELESEKTGSYDVVTAVLCFSELSENELNYAIREVKRILKPGASCLLQMRLGQKTF